MMRSSLVRLSTCWLIERSRIFDFGGHRGAHVLFGHTRRDDDNRGLGSISRRQDLVGHHAGDHRRENGGDQNPPLATPHRVQGGCHMRHIPFLCESMSAAMIVNVTDGWFLTGADGR